ncbi:hypothetical protein Tco_0335339 [Tanacetum coccineum]
MIEAPVLALPYFKTEFTLETGAFGTGLDCLQKRSENGAEDTLSKLSHGGEFNALVLFVINVDLMAKVQASWDNDIDLQQLIQKLTYDNTISRKYTWKDRELRRIGKMEN